jgi:hypothetical protein
VENAKDELATVLREDELADVPIIVLANKQDSSYALSPQVLSQSTSPYVLAFSLTAFISPPPPNDVLTLCLLTPHQSSVSSDLSVSTR